MGRSLAQGFAESAACFETADRVLAHPISRLCFEGPDEQLALTENTQPAILTVSVAALRAVETVGLRVAAAAGHSLGEYSAHVAAGSLSFEDALCTVRSRGRFMQEAVPVGIGAMAAVLGLEADQVERACAQRAGSEVVAPANFNAPGQVVISGHRAAVQRAMEAARQAGARRAVTLDVSAPFHCSLMEPAADRLRPLLDALPLADPRFAVFTNVDARPVTTAGESVDALMRQVASPVRWCESIEAMLADGIDTFVEVGPGRVLSGLVRRINRRARVLNVEDAEGAERVRSELGQEP